jgi:hypothetical protein
MPVHPTLARILAAWKLGGFERMTGSAPRPEDLIVPSRRGRPRNANHALRRFHEDLDRIGLRARRQHDARRTFISIARADGARPDILRWATHGPTGDITDQYTTLPWAALCEEVAKLRGSRCWRASSCGCRSPRQRRWAWCRRGAASQGCDIS